MAPFDTKPMCVPFKKKIPKIAFLTLLFLIFPSCVKDVDMEQYKEISIPPTAAIDLVYFTLTPPDFGASGQIAPVDAVRLEFLDDDYIQESLMRANFNFRFTNSFPQPFTATIQFRSESGSVLHTVVIEIPSGGTTNPAVVDFTEIVNESQITRIRRSIEMRVKVEMHPNAAEIEGELQLQSKAFYTFEFR